ncbi:hypothetical protein [Microcoleus sp. F4-D5]|uniref:hypothetical protein n=1 Tax=Microcoleus sp. F4-D5 TaxID=2818760 RepID=UPI002FD461FB
MVDFHRHTNPVFKPGFAVFLWLFETETAWNLSETDLGSLFAEVGLRCTIPKKLNNPKFLLAAEFK